MGMIEKILQYRSEGLRWHEIDKKMGTKKGTTWARANRAGLIDPKKLWGEEEEEFLIANRDQLGLRRCSELLGFNYDVVKKHSARISKKIGSRMKGAKSTNYSPARSRREDNGQLSLLDIIEKNEVIDAIKRDPSSDSNPSKTKHLATKHFGSWSKARLHAGMGLDSGGVRSFKEATLYFIYFPKSRLYKVGITQVGIDRRFSKFPEYKLIDQWVTDYNTACEFEKLILDSVNRVCYTELHKNGETECFSLKKEITRLEDLITCAESSA